jgi:NIPSNAP
MIIEVRSYKVKASRRDEFIAFFESRAVPAMRAAGIKVFGPLLVLDDPDSFVWLRAYASREERERLGVAFYESPVWKGELESVAMPMLEEYRAVITETSAGFTDFDGTRALWSSDDAG